MIERSCWVVSGGMIGMENQCLGLAEALGFTPVVKRVSLRTPWRQLSPWLRLGLRHAAGPKGDSIAPPWPDLLIGCGRQSIAPSIAARRASKGRTFTIQIQDPAIGARHFDLLVVPSHDYLRGDNVIVTLGGLGRITPERLAEAATRWAPQLQSLPTPRVAVLLGGKCNAFDMGPESAITLGRQLANLARNHGAGLMVTPSRRTDPAMLALIKDALKDLPAIIWDGTGENPYFGFLALADAIVATSDSVNMVSDAAATGKPIFTVQLQGGSVKNTNFLKAMSSGGYTRPFDGTLPIWHYKPLFETQQVAETVRQVLERRAAQRGNPETTAAIRPVAATGPGSMR